MKIKIIDDIRYYELNLLPITQLVGANITKKSFILKSLEKHFSSSKYKEYETHYKNNIRIEDQLIGRNYFKLYKVSKREDLLKAIQLSKSSILYKYINMKLKTYELQAELDKLEIQFDQILNNLNTEMLDGINTIQLTYEQKELLNIIPKSDVQCYDGRHLETLSNYELFIIYIDLIEKINSIAPTKTLVIIENIDHMISYKEYSKLFERNKEVAYKYDYYVLVTSSLKSFVIIDEQFTEGIHIINDEMVILPELYRLVQFVKENYPIDIEINKEEIRHILSLMIQEIGKDNIEFSARSDIFLKLINRSMCLNTKTSSIANSIETKFLKA